MYLQQRLSFPSALSEKQIRMLGLGVAILQVCPAGIIIILYLFHAPEQPDGHSVMLIKKLKIENNTGS